MTFLSADRKVLLTQTFMFRGNLLQEWRWNKDNLRWRKTKNFRSALKELLREVLQRKEIWQQNETWTTGIRDGNRNGNSPSLFEIFKICLKTEDKRCKCLMGFSVHVDIIHKVNNISNNPQLKVGQKDCKTTTCMF